jgi:ABC-type dipeptide/oligopeptide/nickel transport system permease subunit
MTAVHTAPHADRVVARRRPRRGGVRVLAGRSWAQRAALAVLGAVVVFALAGPLVWDDPSAQDLGRFLDPPSLAEPLGRDHLGRSVVARLASATRLSLVLAVLCVATRRSPGRWRACSPPGAAAGWTPCCAGCRRSSSHCPRCSSS